MSKSACEWSSVIKIFHVPAGMDLMADVKPRKRGQHLRVWRVALITESRELGVDSRALSRSLSGMAKVRSC